MARRTCWLIGVLVCLAAAGSTAPARRVAPRVKPYKVSASLSGVSNARLFKGTPAQKRMLARNLFAVTPTDAQQLFYIYENNDYANLPSFVTTDLVLQLYHIFFDFTLRRVESEKLAPLLRQLTGGMLRQATATWGQLQDRELKKAALANVAYFGVAAQALGLDTKVPEEAMPLVKAELARMDRHEGFSVGSIFPYHIDYSQFVPRGHYTRSDVLKRFFRAMMWYGLAPFSFYRRVAPERSGREFRVIRSDETVRMAMLLARGLRQARLTSTWQRIYEPTAFYVGFSDDLTPGEYLRLMDQVYGKDAPMSALADRAKLRVLVEKGKLIRPPRIQPRFRHGKEGGLDLLLPLADPETCQLRLMGQRYVPDSDMLQRLSMPRQRYFPSGMDVMAVLGSPRARRLLDMGYPDLFDTRKWGGYRPERAKLVAEFARLREKDWTANLYKGWLWTLQALIRPAAPGYPSFMRNTAWQDKSLNTALASWAELRHDTILYAKQSASVECGGGEEPPLPKGYVEPNVEFYRRLQSLVRLSRQGLTRRNLLSNELKERFSNLEDLVVFLRRVSEKELRNQKLTREEYEQIKIIGAEVERLTLSVIEGDANAWSEITSETDKDMAVVADVHTGGPAGKVRALEEAVGRANEILVIVPVEGKLQITRGAVFSYYEFLHPHSDRLTDEKWQQMLKSGKAPSPPAWTKSFMPMRKPGRFDQPPMKIEYYGTGC